MSYPVLEQDVIIQALKTCTSNTCTASKQLHRQRKVNCGRS